jgi:hypothetical protein
MLRAPPLCAGLGWGESWSLCRVSARWGGGCVLRARAVELGLGNSWQEHSSIPVTTA